MKKERFFDGITDFIFIEDQPEPSDLIFLPGGNYPEAAVHAAALYHRGMAPLILPSGRYSKLTGYFEGPYETEWEYLSGILMREGVPKKAILREDQATFTYENAVFSGKVLKELGIEARKALLCCQAFHARRAYMYYREQFPDMEILVCPVATRNITRDTWFLSKEGIDTVLGEAERCGKQFHEIMYGDCLENGPV